VVTVLEGRLAGTGRALRLHVADGRISQIETLREDPGAVLMPGLVDLQVNGYDGHDVNAADVDPTTIRAMARALWSRGVTTFLPTVITASEESIVASLRAIAGARAGHDVYAHSVAGAHVEGPHLSPLDGARGAHRREVIRPASVEEFRRWSAAAPDTIRVITVAPEADHALEYIREVAGHCRISLGHSAATPEQVVAAVDAGATLSTHLGNGVPQTLPRHPNLIWTQLAEDRLTAGFIADGHHLDAAAFRGMVRAKGTGRSFLVSDAVALASADAPCGDLTTPVGGEVTLHADKRLTLRGSDLLAGAVKSLDECLRWATTVAGVTFGEALAMASTTPAATVGLAGRGVLTVGASADIAVYDAESEVGVTPANLTLVAGAVVHRGPSDAGVVDADETPDELR
jgi:N-acetylglucosamine-6-phosphate deacetylase